MGKGEGVVMHNKDYTSKTTLSLQNGTEHSSIVCDCDFPWSLRFGAWDKYIVYLTSI